MRAAAASFTGLAVNNSPADRETAFNCRVLVGAGLLPCLNINQAGDVSTKTKKPGAKMAPGFSGLGSRCQWHQLSPDQTANDLLLIMQHGSQALLQFWIILNRHRDFVE